MIQQYASFAEDQANWQFTVTAITLNLTWQQVMKQDPTRWAFMVMPNPNAFYLYPGGAGPATAAGIYHSSFPNTPDGFWLTYPRYRTLIQSSWYAIGSGGSVPVTVFQLFYRPVNLVANLQE